VILDSHHAKLARGYSFPVWDMGGNFLGFLPNSTIKGGDAQMRKMWSLLLE
jgi:hypothetical protein